MMFNNKCIDVLINAIGKETIKISKDVNDKICVSYQYCDIKDGNVLRSVCGRGDSLEEAAYDYLRKINGKTLVFNAESEDRWQCKIICVEV